MRPPRIALAGSIYHITTRCNNEAFFFQEEKDFLLYLEVLAKAKKKYETKVYAYCITNNHVHLLVETPEKNNISQFMQYLNGNYSKKYNKLHGKTGHFWGERFHSTIIDSDHYFMNALVYIEMNMVRARAVDDPKDWRWSSYHSHAFGENDSILDQHPLYDELGNTSQERQENYREMMYGEMESKQLLPNRNLVNGLVIGSEPFVQNILKLVSQHPFYSKRKVYQDQKTFFLRRSYRKLS